MQIKRTLGILYVALIGVGLSWGAAADAGQYLTDADASCEDVIAYPADPTDLTDEQLMQAAYAYDHGKCVDENDQRAYAYYFESVQRGKKIPMLRLGHLHTIGSGVDKDLPQARFWFRSFALTNPYSQKDVWREAGPKVFNGEHLPPLFFDEMTRMETSHASVPMMIQNYSDLVSGNGVIQDINASLEWLTLALLKESAEAQYLMARHAITYDEDIEDYQLYLALAAEGNHPEAQVEYGRLFLGSEGIDPWPYYALIWFIRAQMNGLEVDTEIAEAEKQLSPFERLFAYAKAADFNFESRP